MNKETKFCKDCKHYRPEFIPKWWDFRNNYKGALCMAKPFVHVDLETGERTSTGSFPSIIRMAFGECGPEGKLWEAKE